jgi:fatty acid desaturase
MARSHHRKKHKHFQPPPHTGPQKVKKNAATIFAIAGAVISLIISYSATTGNWVWVIAVTITGSLTGYLIGRSIDREKK